MTASNQRSACVFCKATDRKISKEHVWPKWLRKIVEGGHGGPIEHSRIHETRDRKTVLNESWPDIPFNWQVKGPCEPCNTSWMEGIESETRPVLTPLLEHENRTLDPSDQEILARWATIRVMAQLGHPAERRRAIREGRYHRFCEAKELPPRSQIWLAQRNGEGPWPANYAHKELFIATPESAGPNAYVSAFSVGHVAFVYWGHEVEDGATVHLGEGMKRFLIPIWPANTAINWPPLGLLGATGLETVVENLVATA
jgi:hypothetical protein